MENLYIAVIGSLLILDTTILFQLSVSQPLIICTLLGFYFGDVPLGLQIGIYLQLLWLSSIPTGGAVVPEGNLAAVVSAVMIFRFHQDMQMFHSVLILSILYGLLLSYIGGEFVVFYRKYNVNFLQRLINQLHKGNFTSLPKTIILSSVLHTGLMFVLISMSLYCGDFIFEKISLLPTDFEEYAHLGAIAVIAAGTGLLLHMYKEKWSRLLILTGVIAGFILPAI